MAFDAEPDIRTTHRDRILRLADFLDALPAEKFDMGRPRTDHACQSPACICGWAHVVAWGNAYRKADGSISQAEDIAAHLGLSLQNARDLFLMAVGADTTRHRLSKREFEIARGASSALAARVLRRLAETGEVDWSAQ